jgi:hypothetical protein
VSRSRPHEFTYAWYAAALDAALEAGYRFGSFEEAGSLPLRTPLLLLRHDIDYDPRFVAPISRMEAERGIRATYFFQRDSRFYGADDPTTQAAIKQVLDDGHWLGLHFDATEIASDAEVIARVGAACTLQELRYAGQAAREDARRITAVSFHMPTRRPVGHLSLPDRRVNAYAPVFFASFGYVSDSNQHWRGTDLLDVLTRRCHPALQLLTHPIWWRESFMPASRILNELAAHLGIDVNRIITPEQQAIVPGLYA